MLAHSTPAEHPSSPAFPNSVGRTACSSLAACQPSAGWHWTRAARPSQPTTPVLSAASSCRVRGEVRGGLTLHSLLFVALHPGLLPRCKSHHPFPLPSATADPVWRPCTSPYALQGSELGLGQHTFRARVSGSSAESAAAASTIHLVASGACPPPALVPATWSCAGPTDAAARNAECGTLGQPCCKSQQLDMDGICESPWVLLLARFAGHDK